jgi:hypothetical protein
MNQSFTEIAWPVAKPSRPMLRVLAGLLTLAVTALAGCGGGPATARPAGEFLTVLPGATQVDTNCTGCNATTPKGSAIHQFEADLNNGSEAEVNWSLSGGDATAGAGTISASGQYTPPSFLTADRAEVLVTAELKANPSIRATSVLTVTPGFLQPLTPENVALGPNGTVNIAGMLAEAGGGTGIHFALSDSPSGSAGGQGTLSAPNCQRTERSFTSCTVTYTAPAGVQTTGVTYIVASAGDLASKTEAAILLNAAGVASNPASHQGQQLSPMLLGSSGGNNNDFDAHGNTIVDCCSGTLGALLRDGSGKQYLLSNNHVLARSDQAGVGDSVVQPGLIDNNCTPSGDGAGTLPVGVLTAWLPLDSSATNADAAIAEVSSHAVDPAGNILELGGRLPDGTLTAAPPGISSTDGKGENASLQLRVAKSGRTTGLTCGGISAINVDVSVDYFRDCAETKPYLTKTFTNQLGVSGNRFSDAGDSGALVVDAENAEPIGLYFAGGTDASGVGQGVANPAGELLSELSAQPGTSNFTFVGGADHPVSCLSYGDSSVMAAQTRALSDGEIGRVQQSLTMARLLVNPATGILGVAMGKSSDHPGDAAVIVYISEDSTANVPQTIGGVRTLVIPTDARSVAFGAAPMAIPVSAAPALAASALNIALAVKRQVAHSLMQQNPAYFGIGVGQSLDNPKEAALVIYVDRKHLPADLPPTVNGLRTRYVVMDRLHVTRSFATPVQSRSHCLPHAKGNASNPDNLIGPLDLKLN